MGKIPLQENPVITRLEIIKTLYRLSEKQADRYIKVDPAQIGGFYYNEIRYELRFLKERGLLDFTGNRVSMKFRIALTEAGVRWMEDAYRAFSLEEEEKERLLSDLFAKIRI